jgi:hypothetical protein
MAESEKTGGAVNPELIAEQLRHTIDLLRGEIVTLRGDLAHEKELSGRRLSALEKQGDDHEARLRSVSEGVTQFRMWLGLSSGGSWLASILALVKSFIP